jgi:hypothetical protein
MRNGMKAGLWCLGFLLAWSPRAGIAASDVNDIPIAQWPAPPTWQPQPSPAAANARPAGGRTSLAVLTPALPFFAVTPCRLADTRVGFGFSGAFGPPALVAGVVRNFPITGQCSIPATAQAVSLNFTVVNPSGLGFLAAWQQGGTYPGTSTINYSAGQLVNNAAIVPLGNGGMAVAAGVAGTDLIIDVNGYYAPSGNWTSTAGVTSTTDSVTIGGNLTVSGSITGNPINAKYQDVAEWVPAREPLRPGTVVVVDGARTNGVVASGSAYDTRVAGVVSDSPGVVLGEAGDGKAKVATTGRVKVRVTAVEPIHVGDLLVTSAVGGVAMKSIPLSLGGVPIHRPGTLIGKALEPLSEGEGEILVLLSLQ